MLSAGIEIYLFRCDHSLCGQCVLADAFEGLGGLLPGHIVRESLPLSAFR